jgi:Protein of unknown function (DUF3108)
VYLISHKRNISWARRIFPPRRAFAVLAALAAALITLAAISFAAPAARNAAQDKPRARPLRPLDPIPLPADLEIPRYRPGLPPFGDGETLVYDASWMGIPAAEARVILAHNKLHPDWTGQMWINSSRVVDPIYRMRDYFRENFSRGSLQPENMYLLQHEKSRIDEWNVTFDRGNRLVTSIKKNRHGRIWTRRFSGGNPWGPFSGAMMALSQPLKPGETYTFDVFSGGNRYVFAFTVEKHERITTALGTFDTLRIEPSVVWLSEGSFRSQARQTTVWITDDARHLPVRISSAVFIGEVRADLVRVTNGPAPPPKPRTTASSSIVPPADMTRQTPSAGAPSAGLGK